MKKYEYMIIYKFNGGDGRIFITRDTKINSSEDIEELDKFIEEIKELPVVMVIDFKLLREIDNND